MPEGHTIHRLAGQVEQLFVGHPWRVTSPQGPFTAGADLLSRRVPRRAEAHGKHLFVHLGAEVWHVHLGLYGAFSFRGDADFKAAHTLGAPRVAVAQGAIEYDDAGWIRPDPPRGAVRARVHVPHGWADLRGPVKCAVLTTVQYEQITGRLGPDPLRQSSEIDVSAMARFTDHLRRRRVSIAAALLDQAVIAGVGNIYRAESLFVLGIDPDAPAQSISVDTSQALWRLLTDQLRDGVAEGVIRTVDPADPLLGLRGAQRGVARRHWVYKHQGTPCLRCGENIAMKDLQGRKLYWCPGCQLNR